MTAEAAAAEGFNHNVFINCPFDEDYRPLLLPLLFTLVFAGFNPRLATERSDGYESRLKKICELIAESRFSIHDLSRQRSKAANEFARLNMPFELGIDYGSRIHGPAFMRSKRCLILAGDEHGYKRAASDLAGLDIKSHNEDPRKVIQAVRAWLVETVGIQGVIAASTLWYRFNDFSTALFERQLAASKTQDDAREDIERMPVPEYLRYARQWVETRST